MMASNPVASQLAPEMGRIISRYLDEKSVAILRRYEHGASFRSARLLTSRESLAGMFFAQRILRKRLLCACDSPVLTVVLPSLLEMTAPQGGWVDWLQRKEFADFRPSSR